MWNSLFGWTAVAIYVTVLIGFGWVTVSIPTPQFNIAQWVFTLAAGILVARLAWWIAIERALKSHNNTQVGLFSFVVFGAIGCLWVLSLFWVDGLRPIQLPAPEKPIQGSPRMEIGLALGADKGIGIDPIVDCSKPPYRCLDESQIVGAVLPLDLGSKNWARLIFRLKNVGEIKLVNSSVHIESPSAISIDYAPSPSPKRLPRNVLDVPSNGMDIQPFSISKSDYAVPIDVSVPPGLNDIEINVKVFGDNMETHELRANFAVSRSAGPSKTPASLGGDNESPEITAEFFQGDAPGLVILNMSKTVVREPTCHFVMWNLTRNPPFMIPTWDITEPTKYIKQGTGLLEAIETPHSKPYMKPGDRIFSLIQIDCPTCKEMRAYYLYFVYGEPTNSWFSPAPKGALTNLIQFRDMMVSSDWTPEKFIEKVPHDPIRVLQPMTGTIFPTQQ